MQGSGLNSNYYRIPESSCHYGTIEASDLDSVMAIELGGHAYPWPRTVFQDCFKPGYERWGLWSGEDLMGFAILCWQLDELHLLNLCIKRSDHRSGLGRRLLRFVIARAISESAHCLLLEVRVSNRGAISLYQSEGFSQISYRKNYYPAGHAREDALVMQLALTEG